MSSTEEHIRTAISFLDPEQGTIDIGRARSEMRDALSHYFIEKEVDKKWNSQESIKQQ